MMKNAESSLRSCLKTCGRRGRKLKKPVGCSRTKVKQARAEASTAQWFADKLSSTNIKYSKMQPKDFPDASAQCASEHYSTLRGKSEHELMLATAELRRRAHRHAGQFTVTAKKLADFLASAEGEHALRVQRTKDREAKDIVTTIQAGLGGLPCNPAVVGGTPSDTNVPSSLAVEARPKTLSLDNLTIYEEY